MGRCFPEAMGFFMCRILLLLQFFHNKQFFLLYSHSYALHHIKYFSDLQLSPKGENARTVAESAVIGIMPIIKRLLFATNALQ